MKVEHLLLLTHFIYIYIYNELRQQHIKWTLISSEASGHGEVLQFGWGEGVRWGGLVILDR